MEFAPCCACFDMVAGGHGTSVLNCAAVVHQPWDLQEYYCKDKEGVERLTMRVRRGMCGGGGQGVGEGGSP